MIDKEQEKLAGVLLAVAEAYGEAWSAAHSAVCAQWPPSVLTSGIGNAGNAPYSVRAILRDLAERRIRTLDRSLAAWKASGRRSATWPYRSKHA